MQFKWVPSNICLYKEVDKKYTGHNLKTTELLDCAPIGVCVVIRSNTVYCVYKYTGLQFLATLIIVVEFLKTDNTFLLKKASYLM